MIPVYPVWVQMNWWVSGQAGCTWQAVGESWEHPQSDDSSEEGADHGTGEEKREKLDGKQVMLTNN